LGGNAPVTLFLILANYAANSAEFFDTENKMKAVLFACALAAGLSVASAEAGQPRVQGTAVYVAAGYRFVELQLAGNEMICAMPDRSNFVGLTKGRLVEFSGTFANYAGLYDQVMMMDSCDIKPLPQS
jgi:hypothetical protein